MALNLESCSVREMCEALDGNEKLLNDLRERLGDWLKLQPHLPQDVSKETLEHFIFGSKMSLEQAKRKLDMFYTMKRIVPELLADRDPRGPGLTCLNTIVRSVYLPKLTPDKYRVYIFQPIHDDYTKLSGYDIFKYALMMDELLSTESRQLGNIFVFDHSMVSVSFLTKFTPTLFKKCEIVITEAHARRVKGIHVTYAVPLTDTLASMAKKVLKPKLAARVCTLYSAPLSMISYIMKSSSVAPAHRQIHVHRRGSLESFYQHIPKSILPKDYGGDERSMAELAELWRQKLDEKREWFLEQDKIVVDEKLRPGPAVNCEDLFGFSGSFRKLDVD